MGFLGETACFKGTVTDIPSCPSCLKLRVRQGGKSGGQSGYAVFSTNEAIAPLQTFLQIRPGFLINILIYNKEKMKTIKAYSNLSFCQGRGDPLPSPQGRHPGTAQGWLDLQH